MKLRQAETFSVLYNDDRRIRYVDAHFNHGRRDKDLAVRVLGREGFHRGILVGGLHLAVKKRDLPAEARFKVDVAVFRGREIAHPEIGRRILERLINELSDVAMAETMPRQEGNQMHVILTGRAQRKSAPRPKPQEAPAAAVAEPAPTTEEK